MYIYHNYFAKDKPLRHYTQHLFLSLLGLLVLPYLEVNNISEILPLYLLSTFIVDLDGLLSVFIFRKKIPEVGQIVGKLKSLKFIESATLGTIHHKKLNRLVLHNVIGLFLLIAVFVYFVNTKSISGVTICWAIIIHFGFDIFDDLYQLGHLKNWLWPIEVLKKI